MDVYVFRPYDQTYTTLFEREKKKLERIIGQSVRIDHIGSTAISGLGGKGIIDIVVSVNHELIEKIKQILAENSYSLKTEPPKVQRIFFRKDDKYFNTITRVHVHLTHKNSMVWKEAISFREYLRANRSQAARYAELKKGAVAFSRGDGKKYRKYKADFLKKTTEEALKTSFP